MPDEARNATGDWVPRPDPTLLTTEALLREVGNLREILTARMDAMDHATDLRLVELLKVPAETAELIKHLQDLHDEKFRSIALQFTERDIRTDQASRASKEALDAALQAAKELVGAQGEASAAAAIKSETSFTKQIDQIGTIIQTLEKAMDARITDQGKALDARINELKERIDRGAGIGEGAQGQRVESRQQNAGLYALIGAVGLLVLVLIALRGLQIGN